MTNGSVGKGLLKESFSFRAAARSLSTQITGCMTSFCRGEPT
jgi:hypothetical protein